MRKLADAQMQSDLEPEITTIAFYFAVPNNEIWLKFTSSISKLPDFWVMDKNPWVFCFVCCMFIFESRNRSS